MNDIQNRFLTHVKKTDTCWLWIGAKKGQNYGSFSINGKDYRAHRIAFKLFISEYDQNLNVLHHCDNTLCVRPDHLFLGTHKKNMQDKVLKNRHQHGEISVRSKLKNEDVLNIRQSLKNYSKDKVDYLSNKYSVSVGCILDIYYKRTWKHL